MTIIFGPVGGNSNLGTANSGQFVWTNIIEAAN